MEWIIDEQVLNEYMDLTAFGGDMEHRGMNAFFKQIAMLGYLFRDEHKIILTNGEVRAEYDDDYDEYLDMRASGVEDRNWEVMNPIQKDEEVVNDGEE
jgi:hypothetical protein